MRKTMSEFSYAMSVREVLLYIKYSRDKDQLRKLVDTDPHYQEMDLDAAMVINTVTSSKLKLNKKEGKVNVCLAIEEMRRIDDLKRAAQEPGYQARLMKEILPDISSTT